MKLIPVKDRVLRWSWNNTCIWVGRDRFWLLVPISCTLSITTFCWYIRRQWHNEQFSNTLKTYPGSQRTFVYLGYFYQFKLKQKLEQNNLKCKNIQTPIPLTISVITSRFVDSGPLHCILIREWEWKIQYFSIIIKRVLTLCGPERILEPSSDPETYFENY